MACTCRKRRPRWLDRTFAALMSKGSRYYNALADQLKRDLFARLNLPASESSVLEIGVGTGPNMAYYPRQTVSPSCCSQAAQGTMACAAPSSAPCNSLAAQAHARSPCNTCSQPPVLLHRHPHRHPQHCGRVNNQLQQSDIPTYHAPTTQLLHPRP
jgi:hypothetical protein